MHLTFTLSKYLKKTRKLTASLSVASTCSITIRPPGLHVSYSPQTGGARDNFPWTRRLRNLCSRSAAPVSEGGRRGRTGVFPEQLLGSSQQQKERTREGRERLFSMLAVSGRVNEELFLPCCCYCCCCLKGFWIMHPMFIGALHTDGERWGVWVH